MDILHIFSVLIVLSAVFAYCNQRFIKLPTTIGLMLLGLMLSLVLQIAGSFSPLVLEQIKQNLGKLDFSDVLLEYMLSFLLFAGSLHAPIEKLAETKWPILTFATLGVIFSAFIAGSLLYFILPLLHFNAAYVHCLLFGALIAPTDPVAVLGILRQSGVPPSIEAKITGEALFNDGVAVVLFITLDQFSGENTFHLSETFLLLAKQVLGGVVLGAVLGYGTVYLLKSINHYQTETLITVALVTGGQMLARELEFSGPLTIVVTGLLIGNAGKKAAMSDLTSDYISKFWELADDILNAILFVLIGLELLLIPFYFTTVMAGMIAFIVVVAARYLSLSLPSVLFNLKKNFAPNALVIMTWGGLKGGISIALALMLHPFMQKNLVLSMTYIVVMMSLLLQGLSIERFIKRINKAED